MPGYLAYGTAQTRFGNREGCVVPQYEFNFRDAHSYRTFPRLSYSFYFAVVTTIAGHTLQDVLGECNCKTGHLLIVQTASYPFGII